MEVCIDSIGTIHHCAHWFKPSVFTVCVCVGGVWQMRVMGDNEESHVLVAVNLTSCSFFCVKFKLWQRSEEARNNL